MKRLILLAGLSALVSTAALATTTPHASGAYLMAENQFCPAVASGVSVPGAVTYAGEIHQMAGVVTLTPSKSNATSGTMTFTLQDNDGPVVNIGGGGFQSEGISGSGTYSLSGGTLVITPAGQPSQTYTAYSGLVSSAGVIQDVFAQRLDGSGCSDQLIVRLK